MGAEGGPGKPPLPGFGERLLQGARWAPLPRPPVPQQGAQASRRCRAQGRFAVTCLPSRGLLFAVVSLCEAPARGHALPRPHGARAGRSAPSAFARSAAPGKRLGLFTLIFLPRRQGTNGTHLDIAVRIQRPEGT